MLLFNPGGPIEAYEKFIMLAAIGLMLIVVIPVFGLTFWFAWHYRASNTKAVYAPKWHQSRAIELAVWLVPAAIVTVLSYLVWTSTHALDPYKPLAATARQDPLPVDVVALNWKWLFIYPRQHIATVNQLVVPAKTPVSFRLTSDTVMTSFFIPRLGSQIYAMPGMRTKLHLLADKPGTYVGRNYQLSGRGYSWMQFKVISVPMKKFNNWVAKVKKSPKTLDVATLQKLEKPGISYSTPSPTDEHVYPVIDYASVPPHLFDYIIHQVVTGGAAYASNGVAHVG
jgi:cytochrome o ubiquinol oxidase subunit 2